MSLVDRAKNIITSPKSEWEVISNEPADMGSILTGYVVPMALLPAVASFIGYGLIGVGPFSSIMVGVASALISLLSTIIGVLITAFVVNLLASGFDSEKDMGKAMQLVAYSYTPAWIGGILNIFPPLMFIGALFGLYGIYIMYLGFPHMMKTPKDKVVVYMIVTVVVLFVVYLVIGLFLSTIIFSIFGLSAAALM